jgi:hypothetical protein
MINGLHCHGAASMRWAISSCWRCNRERAPAYLIDRMAPSAMRQGQAATLLYTACNCRVQAGADRNKEHCDALRNASYALMRDMRHANFPSGLGQCG